MAIKSADQITIVDVTDAYSIILTSEAYTFVGATDGVAAGATCSTQAVAFCGSNACSSVNVNASSITCPTGISATVQNSGSPSPTITFTTTAKISTACEAIIPVVVDGITVNKKFSFAVALRGSTGAQGPGGTAGVSLTGVTAYYLASSSNSGITTSSSGWTTTMQATDTTKKYLWSYQKISYSNSTSSNTVPVIIGTHGATGSTGQTGPAGNGISKVEVFYLTTSASSGVTTSSSGWSTTPTATTTTNKYIWSYQKTTYTNGSTVNSTPAIIGTHGATGPSGANGADGADAIVLTITSSNGIVFKNSTGSTVLTAHMYVGGVEQTITDAGVCGSLGSIKWYKGSSTTEVATAKTYTVSASTVTNAEVITAQLEK